MDYESQFMTHNEDMQEIYDAIQDVLTIQEQKNLDFKAATFSWLQSVGLDINNKEYKT